MSKGMKKYLFKLRVPQYRGRKLHDIIMEEKVEGYIYGINLKPLDICSKDKVEEYISMINDVVEEEYTSIYIEEELSLETIRLIEDSLSISKSEYKDLLIYNIPYIIDEFKLKIKGDFYKEEILILSDKKEIVLKITDALSEKFSFISVLGLNDSDRENVYEVVFENTGISIYYPQGNNISLRRYGLIINILDEFTKNYKDIRNNAIILDFSDTKVLKGFNRYVIEGIGFDISDVNLVDNPWISNEVSDSVYSCMFKGERRIFSKVLNNDELITIEDFLDQGSIRIKGRF